MEKGLAGRNMVQPPQGGAVLMGKVGEKDDAGLRVAFVDAYTPQLCWVLCVQAG